MKLNVKKTVQVGFAFLSICAFWQMYNAIIPIILTYTFHMNETISGAIMAADQCTCLVLTAALWWYFRPVQVQMGQA